MSKIEQPEHYQGRDGISANDVIRAFKLNFALGNVVKYILRAGRKPNESALDDVRKALWYLNDEYRERAHMNNSDLKEFAAREQRGETRRTFIDALCEHRDDD